MKKLFLVLFCLFTICTSFAQTPKQASQNYHLKFKGISIDGSPNEFGAKLKEAGFSYINKYEGVPFYKGNFAGHNNCEVAIKSNNNLVYEVVVLFPKNYSWNQLYRTYSYLKKILTEKYGEPLCKEEFINTPSYVNINDDNDKYSEVGYGRCSYGSAFLSIIDGAGSILLEIKDSHCVGLHYTDFHNELKKDSAAKNDL
jgi:hypothetical protein